MIPIRDVIPSRTTPWVTLVLIGVNLAVFAYELVLPEDAFRTFAREAGLVPAGFSWTAATTSLFVHGNLIHISGNLVALWVFGENVEDQLGHGRYLAFYLAAGNAAALADVWATPQSTIPLIGASGAIAGVLGAYFVMFPRSRVLVLIPVFFFVDLVEVPAVLFAGIWFGLEVLGNVGRLAMPSVGGGAFWAHLGGLTAGLSLVALLRRPERSRVEWWGA